MRVGSTAVSRFIRLLGAVGAGVLIGAVGLFVADCLLVNTAGEQEACHHDLLVRSHYEYLTEEGHAARGSRFGDFMLLLDSEVKAGHRVSERQLLDYAGAPNHVKQEAGVKWLEFVFSRYTPCDWAVFAVVRQGVVEQLSYGPALQPPKPPDNENAGIPGTPY